VFLGVKKLLKAGCSDFWVQDVVILWSRNGNVVAGEWKWCGCGNGYDGGVEVKCGGANENDGE
jgi:hypothetical protein